jgi:cell division septum initiation protein DivIVA
MDDLFVNIKELQETVQTLLKEYADVKKENEQLKQQIIYVKQEVAEKEKSIESMQQKFVSNQIAGLYDTEDKKILKARIDVYLKDIEKCLSLLNT